MTDALLAYGIAKIKEYGIVDSGDAKTDGIGAMTEARWRDFFETMSKAGVYPEGPRFPQGLHAAVRQQESGMQPDGTDWLPTAAGATFAGYAAGHRQALRASGVDGARGDRSRGRREASS